MTKSILDLVGENIGTELKIGSLLGALVKLKGPLGNLSIVDDPLKEQVFGKWHVFASAIYEASDGESTVGSPKVRLYNNGTLVHPEVEMQPFFAGFWYANIFDINAEPLKCTVEGSFIEESGTSYTKTVTKDIELLEP